MLATNDATDGLSDDQRCEVVRSHRAAIIRAALGCARLPCFRRIYRVQAD